MEDDCLPHGSISVGPWLVMMAHAFHLRQESNNAFPNLLEEKDALFRLLVFVESLVCSHKLHVTCLTLASIPKNAVSIELILVAILTAPLPSKEQDHGV